MRSRVRGKVVRRVARIPLTRASAKFLRKRSRRVADAADPAAEAKRLWNLRKNLAFAEIREKLAQMAWARVRCMYCEDSLGTAIDHFYPISQYHGRAYQWDNYLLACSRCNSNLKRDQFPIDQGGLPLLVDPTSDDPLDHLSLSFATGAFVALTPKGSGSVAVFHLDNELLTQGRRNVWIVLCELLPAYAAARNVGNNDKAERLKVAIRGQPFSAVLYSVSRRVNEPGIVDVVPDSVLEAFRQCPEIHTWV